MTGISPRVVGVFMRLGGEQEKNISSARRWARWNDPERARQSMRLVAEIRSIAYGGRPGHVRAGGPPTPRGTP